MTQPILTVEHLSVEYKSTRGKVKAIRDVSFDLLPGETLAFIGESGCGKTTLALSLVRLLPAAATITAGKIGFRRGADSIDVLALGRGALRNYRWRDCAMVFQSALNALNPVLRISSQVQDTARAHGERDAKKIERRALDLFEQVRLDPYRVYNAYPHELSGGMRQRVLIAIGVLLNPQVVILDEPTTALDVLTQRTVIDVLKRLRDQMGFAIVFISHDLSMAAELAHRLVTMYAGQIVETGPIEPVFYEPQHPYTLGLLRAAPALVGPREELSSIPGSPPDLINPLPACSFVARCPFARPICSEQPPPLQAHTADISHVSACHFWQEPMVARKAYREAVMAGLRKAERDAVSLDVGSER